jgi:deoxyribose-phosphate aldolase
MQTGQNSIAPENSLPQLGQVRWGSMLIDLTVLQPQSEPKATPRSIEWCEIAQRYPLANDGPASIASLCIQPSYQIRARSKIRDFEA